MHLLVFLGAYILFLHLFRRVSLFQNLIDRFLSVFTRLKQELISRLDSRTLPVVNVLGPSDFSNNIKNAY